MDTCITNTSICIEHIINSVQHQIKITRRLKIEGSMKLIRTTQGMKSDFNEGIRSVMSIDRYPDRKLKLLDLMTYLEASNDIINIHPDQGFNSCDDT
jgi:hypothetical protein